MSCIRDAPNQAQEADLTPDQIERGMQALRKWYDAHPEKDGFVVLAGSDEDCWTPRMILHSSSRLDLDDPEAPSTATNGETPA